MKHTGSRLETERSSSKMKSLKKKKESALKPEMHQTTTSSLQLRTFNEAIRDETFSSKIEEEACLRKPKLRNSSNSMFKIKNNRKTKNVPSTTKNVTQLSLHSSQHN
jgi:hypothetical protein